MINIVTAAVIAAAAITPSSSGAWICQELDNAPTVRTVENIVLDLIHDGWDSQNGSEYLVGTVAAGCPEYLPVLRAFAEKWG